MRVLNHLYLHGFASGPGSTKATEVKKAVEARGGRVAVPDLNVPSFEHLTLTAMLAEARKHLWPPSYIWGSSLGGYLATLLAEESPDEVAGLILMAPAVEFPTSFPARSAEARETWARGGSVPTFHHGEKRELPLAGDLAADCANFKAAPRIACRTLVFAAKRDEVIPLETIERWVSRLHRGELVVLDDVHDLQASTRDILRQALTFTG